MCHFPGKSGYRKTRLWAVCDSQYQVTALKLISGVTVTLDDLAYESQFNIRETPSELKLSTFRQLIFLAFSSINTCSVPTLLSFYLSYVYTYFILI